MIATSKQITQSTVGEKDGSEGGRAGRSGRKLAQRKRDSPQRSMIEWGLVHWLASSEIGGKRGTPVMRYFKAILVEKRGASTTILL